MRSPTPPPRGSVSAIWSRPDDDRPLRNPPVPRHRQAPLPRLVLAGAAGRGFRPLAPRRGLATNIYLVLQGHVLVDAVRRPEVPGATLTHHPERITPVEQLRLSLVTIGDLDRGKVARAVDVALLRMQRDVEDRPFEPKPRVVT